MIIFSADYTFQLFITLQLYRFIYIIKHVYTWISSVSLNLTYSFWICLGFMIDFTKINVALFFCHRKLIDLKIIWGSKACSLGCLRKTTLTILTKGFSRERYFTGTWGHKDCPDSSQEEKEEEKNLQMQYSKNYSSDFAQGRTINLLMLVLIHTFLYILLSYIQDVSSLVSQWLRTTYEWLNLIKKEKKRNSYIRSTNGLHLLHCQVNLENM